MRDKMIAVKHNGQTYYNLAAVAKVIRKTWTAPNIERRFAPDEVEWWCGLLEAMDRAK